MINNQTNGSLFRGGYPPVAEAGEGRKIAGGPLYSAVTVRDLAERTKVTLWSRGAAKDAQKWSLDIDRVGELICKALSQGCFLGSEWCVQQPNGPWAACDAYSVTVQEWTEATHSLMKVTYYLKFALGKTGQILLSASNHPEGT